MKAQELLATNPDPARTDPDPNHWRVAGVYSGSYTYGQAQIVSTHGLFSLVDDLPAE